MDIQNCNIPFVEIKDEGNRIIISDGRNKFSFFKQKQDGTETRAYQSFKALKCEEGRIYSCGVTESAPQKFTNKDGKEIVFTYHNIICITNCNPLYKLYRRPSFKKAPVQQPEPEIPPAPKEEEINIKDIPF